ncbi:MAG: imidazole glycerol phosphate synthase subunit HisH [Candidatus Methylacidiphilales bacterium]
MSLSIPPVAVVDFGLGNLFSVQLALTRAGLSSIITDNPEDLRTAPAVIVPGVGAFGDAMNALRARKLDAALHDYRQSGRPIVGICLGQQLFMEESEEFGAHKGLGFIPGTVRRLPAGLLAEDGRKIKVPTVGWNTIARPAARPTGWAGTLLEGVREESDMYFVHSYRVILDNDAEALATTTYAGTVYCSALQQDNITAFQFHPEKSGQEGQKIYQNLAAQLAKDSGVPILELHSQGAVPPSN